MSCSRVQTSCLFVVNSENKPQVKKAIFVISNMNSPGGCKANSLENESDCH